MINNIIDIDIKTVQTRNICDFANSIFIGLNQNSYKSELKDSKLKTEARFNFKEVSKFELLNNQPSRIKIIYFNENMSEEYKNKLKLFNKETYPNEQLNSSKI